MTETPAQYDAPPASQILESLSAPIPPKHLAQRKQGSATLTYIPWHHAVLLLDRHAPGWSWEIRSVTVAGDRIVLVGRLSIPTAEGVLIREATGQERLDCGSYGDPSSNAESMALRLAAAKFGLGLYLYRKEDQSNSTRKRTGKEVSREEWLARRSQQPPLRPRAQPSTADGLSID